MLGAFVLRLVLEPLARGEVVGHVEDVDTGERASCGDAVELLAFLRRIALTALERDSVEHA